MSLVHVEARLGSSKGGRPVLCWLLQLRCKLVLSVWLLRVVVST